MISSSLRFGSRMNKRNLSFFAAALAVLSLSAGIFGQSNVNRESQRVRTVTIPISIYTKQELRGNQAEEFVQADRLIVEEDKDEQTILSIRSVTNTPLALAIVIQDDLSSNFNLQIDEIKEFIRGLPNGSRVMVAYARGGTMQVRQKFTEDLDRAANSLRIVTSSTAAAPRSPYDSVVDTLGRFDALPTGRRAILLVSDGLDTSEGLSGLAPINTLELDRAILRAQRKGVAVYSFYSPASLTAGESSILVLRGQSALQKLSEETGGRAFYQGSIAPISFDPFFTDLSILLNRQFALTYLSTHMNKGYHKVEVRSTNPEVKIDHPKGYYYR
jgi:VWFA-related protein